MFKCVFFIYLFIIIMSKLFLHLFTCHLTIELKMEMITFLILKKATGMVGFGVRFTYEYRVIKSCGKF